MILPKLAAWLIAKEHSAGKHVATFSKKIVLRFLKKVLGKNSSPKGYLKKVLNFIQCLFKPFPKVPAEDLMSHSQISLKSWFNYLKAEIGARVA